MQEVVGSNSKGKVTDRQYDPIKGVWRDVYGTPPKPKTSKKKPKSTKKEPAKAAPKPKPQKPSTADKGTDHRGSGEDNEKDVVERTREIEYDLEGSLELRPIKGITARQMINLQGLGLNFSGKYFVATVIHTINRSGYSMQMDLLRRNFEWKISTPPPQTSKKQPKKEAPKARTYTVKRGDTLWAIAKRFYGKGSLYMKIVNANKGKIKNPHWIYPGQSFVIPA